MGKATEGGLQAPTSWKIGLTSSNDRVKTKPGSGTLKRNGVFKALFYSENSLYLLSAWIDRFYKLYNTLYLPLISGGAKSFVSQKRIRHQICGFVVLHLKGLKDLLPFCNKAAWSGLRCQPQRLGASGSVTSGLFLWLWFSLKQHVLLCLIKKSV